jgi:hypothetical protein
MAGCQPCLSACPLLAVDVSLSVCLLRICLTSQPQVRKLSVCLSVYLQRICLTSQPQVPKLKLELYNGTIGGDGDPTLICHEWIEEPVMLYFNPFNDNLFHFMLDTLTAVFPTLEEQGLLAHFQLDKWESLLEHPEKMDLCRFQVRLSTRLPELPPALNAGVSPVCCRRHADGSSVS